VDAVSRTALTVGATGGVVICPKADVAVTNVANKRKSRGHVFMIPSGFVIIGNGQKLT